MSSFTNPAAFLFKKPFEQKIGALVFDLLMSSTISEKVAVTNNPVEGGFNTDNSRNQPTEISVSGLMSEFSLKNGVISRAIGLAEGSKLNRLKDAYDELYNIKDAQEPIVFVAKYREYKNMLMTSLDINSNPNDGKSLRFTCGFTEIRIASSQLVNIDNSIIKTDNAKKKSNFGKQTKTPKTFTPPAPKLTLSQFIGSLF